MVEIRHKKLYFKGRKDNQIKISGQLVVTDEVVNNLEKETRKLFSKRTNYVQFLIDIIYDTQKYPTGMIAYHTANDQQEASSI